MGKTLGGAQGFEKQLEWIGAPQGPVFCHITRTPGGVTVNALPWWSLKEA